jgi:hypothetical protein
VQGEEKLLKKDDTHAVFIRPKAIVDSSGTTWANETMELRNILPDKFEVREPSRYPNYSSEFRGICSRMHDNVKLFLEMTMEEDLARACEGNGDSQHCKYEKERLSHLIVRLEYSVSLFVNKTTEAESRILASIIPMITNLIDKAQKLHDNLPAALNLLQDQYDTVLKLCSAILEKIGELNLPPVKPRWADFSDAGTGVGCNNFEVQFRDAEMAILHNSDYRIKLHSSRGNSSDNEAERTNSAIGDSIVDGSTLEWNQYKRFDGLSDDEISKLTVKVCNCNMYVCG